MMLAPAARTSCRPVVPGLDSRPLPLPLPVAPHITFCFPASGQCSGGGVADDKAYLSSLVLLFLLPNVPIIAKSKHWHAIQVRVACNWEVVWHWQ